MCLLHPRTAANVLQLPQKLENRRQVIRCSQSCLGPAGVMEGASVTGAAKVDAQKCESS